MRVLVSGYYGFGNLGDEALLAGLITGLHRYGHQPVILSGDPAASRDLHGVPATERLRGLLPALLRADAVISGGGGLLQDGTSRRSLDYYLGVIRLAKRLGKRVVVYGQSLGPLSDQGMAATASALHGVPLALRDEQSLELANAMGLAAVLVADAALLLEPVAPATRLAAVAEEDRPVVLIPRGGQEHLNEPLGTVAAALAAEGVPLATMSLHPQQDDAPVKRLQELVPSMPRLAADTPTRALAELGGARFVVSVRLHGCILAARAGVGFAGLSYDPKVRGFLNQAGAATFERPVDQCALLKLTRASPPPSEHALDHLLRLSQDGIDWLQLALTARR